MYKIEFDKYFQKRINEWVDKYPREVAKATLDTTIFAENTIVRATPAKTGVARASWSQRKVNDFTYSIDASGSPGNKYVKFLETGTGLFGPLHRRIRPRKAKFLVFPIIQGNTPVAWIRTKSTAGMKAVGMVKNNVPKIKQFFLRTMRDMVTRKWGK